VRSYIQNTEQETMVELKSGSAPHRGKGTVGWYMGRSSEKCSKREEQAKRY